MGAEAGRARNAPPVEQSEVERKSSGLDGLNVSSVCVNVAADKISKRGTSRVDDHTYVRDLGESKRKKDIHMP